MLAALQWNFVNTSARVGWGGVVDAGRTSSFADFLGVVWSANGAAIRMAATKTTSVWSDVSLVVNEVLR